MAIGIYSVIASGMVALTGSRILICICDGSIQCNRVFCKAKAGFVLSQNAPSYRTVLAKFGLPQEQYPGSNSIRAYSLHQNWPQNQYS